MMSPKKPMCLTLYQKALIIHELKTGASVTQLSKKYGVAKSTICKIKSKEQVILSALANTCTAPGKRTLRESKNPEMEKKLYEWYQNERKNSVMVSVDMIKEKAKAIHSDIKNDVNKEFTASDGWLQRFKKRYGIRYLGVKGEKLSTSSEFISGVINWDAVYTQVENTDEDEITEEKHSPASELITGVIKWDEVHKQVENTAEDENGNHSEESEENPTVTPESAVIALNTTIQWAKENRVDYNYISVLNDLLVKAIMQTADRHKNQTKITDYF